MNVNHATAQEPEALHATVSVIVCTYTDRRADLLVGSIESILGQLNAGDELIIVVDHNDVLHKRIVDQYGTSAVVVENKFKRGLSGARNSGVEAAGGVVIAFVDDDAQVQDGWLEGMRSHYAKADVVGVGGWADPVWPAGRPSWFPDEFDWVVGCSHRGLPIEVSPVRNFLGCNMSFRSSALRDAGTFSDEVGRVGTVPVGCEETELCIRMAQQSTSASLILDPKVTVQHWVSDDRTKLRYFVRRCFAEGTSKQRVSGMVGSSDALSSERRYVTTVLPVGVARGFFGVVSGRGSRRAHFARSWVIVLGLSATVAGYCYAALRTIVGADR